MELDEVTITAPTAFKFDFEAGKKVLFPKGYTDKQVEVINAQVIEANAQGIVIKSQLAYILATNFHECFNWNDSTSRMTQLVEMGGEKYLKAKPYYPYYGRGMNHLTWDYNYRKEGKRLGLDLIKNPDLMLNIKTAANSAVYCMMSGTYTGKKLYDYLTNNKTDFQGARAIINGKDQAPLIAGYASEFLKCII